ncbi:MAG: hypothetical protein H0V12_09945 [Chloroflexi bacterium]|nr:hypothetical protein [Chloroflexota bacterium]
MGHGHAGAQWLREQGYGELARAVAGHPVTRLADDREYAEWMTRATPEIRLVAYADKRATDRLLSLRARLDDMERRHPEHAAALRRARPRAERLERAVCDAAGVQPEQVARLPWAGEALGLPPDRQPDGAAA